MNRLIALALTVMLNGWIVPQPPPAPLIEIITPEPITMTMELTAYCGCSYCCGNSCGLTASGTVPTQGRTIAVDWNVIPEGTHVIIDGIEYVVEDKPAEGVTAIDVYFDNHDDAIEFGRQTREVTIIED